MLVAPVAVLNGRLVKRNNRPVAQVLIQWSNVMPEDATFIRSQFPQFDF